MKLDDRDYNRRAIARPSARVRHERPSAMTRFAGLLKRLPKYTRLAWELVRDDRLDGAQKGVLYLGLGYLALPFDLVPGFIPVAGQLDDLAAVLLALRTVLRSLPPAVAADHLQEAGLTFADIDYDLSSVALTVAWLARQAGAVLVRGLGAAAGALAQRVSSGLGGRRKISA